MRHSSRPLRSEPEDFAHRPENFAEPGSHRVLVVDEDFLVRWALGESLRSAGYEVVEAGDVASAMRALASPTAFSLVFLDESAAETGPNVLAAIRRERPRLPIVFMTAQDSDDLRRRALKSGVATILKKPFDVADIESVADRAVEASLM